MLLQHLTLLCLPCRLLKRCRPAQHGVPLLLRKRLTALQNVLQCNVCTADGLSSGVPQILAT